LILARTYAGPSQQSADDPQLLAPDEKSFLQLSFPHVRPFAQCRSSLQSPSPILHGFLLVQQLQSVVGIPLHVEDGGCSVAGLKQQSALVAQLLPVVEKSFLQLSLPHLRPFAHSLSLLQSPWPKLQGRVEEQQDQSVVGTPSHAAGEDIGAVVLAAAVLPAVVVTVVVVVIVVDFVGLNIVVVDVDGRTVSIHLAQFLDV